MKTRSTQGFKKLTVLIAALFLLGISSARAVSVYDVHLDTSAFAGQSAVIQFLAFDLIDGDAASGNNSVTAGSFVTDGVLVDASDVVLQDDFFFNEELREVTFGTYLDFTLELTENYVPPGLFDQFSFFILDSAFQLLVESTDPTGASALFAIDIDGTPGGDPFVYSSLTPIFSWTVNPRSASTPVPDSGNTFFYLILSCAILVGIREARTCAPEFVS